ncbi:NEL-type E3 ubiquitin ligase domain-containing protein [Pseudomonas entomophila]|uniref:NEL-type E3 ubiquitin ligase domain-containing protein n=1 Tax=Pseudomonas entomophila TaxID=312306 RepID=UPI00200F0091|nr:NEL-type E3 ubiquitin ligase domain-containing protein [Pseudomonas entomophila]
MTDTFIASRLPAWLRATPARVRALAECFRAHALSRQALAMLTEQLVSPQRYAEQHFQPLMNELVSDCPPLAELDWLEIRRRFSVPPLIGLPSDEINEVRLPALLRLMQGFSSDASFYAGTGITVTGEAQLLSIDLDNLLARVRALDLGARYHEYLNRMFTPQAQTALATHHRTGFALACQLGLLKGTISPAEHVALSELPSRGQGASKSALQAYAGALRILGCTVANGLKIQLRDESGNSQGIVLYLPSLQDMALQRFDSLAAMNAYLIAALAKGDVRRHFRELIGLGERAQFVETLDTRLRDDAPDLDVQGRVADGDVFAALASMQVERFKDEGKLLLVANTDVDHQAAEQRFNRWKAIGWQALGLVGLAVPGVGVVLLAKVTLDTLGEACEGAVDWSQGHQHEAMEHMLHVAETVAVTSATVIGFSLVARRFQGSAFVDALQPVTVEGRGARLWNPDLEVYASTPDQPLLQDDGLYAVGQRRWIRVGEHYYEVHRPAPNLAWRLRHPRGDGNYEPLVQHNGERFWRIRLERPMEWDDSVEMLNRLWPHEPPFDAPQAEQILKVAGVDQEELRSILVENRPAPVNLRDTLRRFDADARISALFERLRLPGARLGDTEVLEWCRGRAQMQALDEPAIVAHLVERRSELQGPLLDHLSREVLPDDGLLALLQRDFPFLPQVYAREALRDVAPEVRAQALAESRLPLSIGKKARALFELARANRAVEGLYLPTAYSNETGELVLALLRRLPGWPSRVNVELREGSDSGRLLAIMDPQGPSHQRVVMFARDGQFRLYDSQGREREEDVAEPGGIFQALAALLGEADRTALKFVDSDPAQQLRGALQALLPAQRSHVLARLGWRVEHRWFNPGKRLPDGRVGYPLGGRASRLSSRTLGGRVRALYPSIGDEGVERIVQRLIRENENPFMALLEQEENYQQLDEALEDWVQDEPQRLTRGIRAQFAHRLRSLWRYEGEPGIDGQGQVNGLRLDVSGWRVGRLPDLPAEVDFSHVTELVMVNMDLTEVRGNFLRCFESLRVLNLNNNRIDALPPGVTGLGDLSSLLLMSNHIRMSEADQHILAHLSNLRTLDLSFNPIQQLALQFDHLPQLTELRANSCGLLEVPAGIQSCGLLSLADLSRNQITSIPEAVHRMPWSFRRRLILVSNPLTPQAVGQLYRVDAHQARLIRELEQGEVSGAVALSRWQAIDDENGRAAHSALWQRIEALPGSDGLFRLFGNLTQTPDFTRAPEYLRGQLWSLLEAIDQEPALREEVFLHADEVRGCHDSHAERFSRLQLHVLTFKARAQGARGEGENELLNLGRQLFRMDRVDEYAAQDVRDREAQRGPDDPEIDELEVIVGYRSALAADLDLPSQPRHLRFAGLADITEARAKAALAAVRAAENIDALASSIGQRDFWRSFLEMRHGAAFMALAQSFDDQGAKLDEAFAGPSSEGPAAGLTSEEYKQRWGTLMVARAAAEHALATGLTREALERAAEVTPYPAGQSAQPD